MSLKSQTEEQYRYSRCNGFGREIIGQLKYPKRVFSLSSEWNFYIRLLDRVK